MPHPEYPLPLDKLAAFVEALAALARGETMEKAAQAAGTDAKTVQRWLHLAAKHTGERLHDPVKRAVTDAGREYLAAARGVVETYRGRLFPCVERPLLVGIACYPSLASNFLPRVFAQLGLSDTTNAPGARSLADHHPGTSLRLVMGNRGDFFDDLSAGAVHLAVATAGRTSKVSGTLVEEALFVSERVGVIYHKDNPNRALRARPLRLECLATECLLWLGADRTDGLEPPLARLLPEPAARPLAEGGPVRHGRRVVLPTYQSVLVAVRHGVGVGVGHLPGPGDADVRFVPFAEIAAPEPLRAWHDKLVAQERTRFALFRRAGWEKPAEDGGLPEAAKFVAEAVRRAAQGYEHRYS